MQSLPDEKHVFSTPYNIFVYSISNELTRRYYEQRLRQFFDYIQFDLYSDLRERSNSIVARGLTQTGRALNQIILFLQFQKDRIKNGEIAGSESQECVYTIRRFKNGYWHETKGDTKTLCRRS